MPPCLYYWAKPQWLQLVICLQLNLISSGSFEGKWTICRIIAPCRHRVESSFGQAWGYFWRKNNQSFTLLSLCNTKNSLTNETKMGLLLWDTLCSFSYQHEGWVNTNDFFYKVLLFSSKSKSCITLSDPIVLFLYKSITGLWFLMLILKCLKQT